MAQLVTASSFPFEGLFQSEFDSPGAVLSAGQLCTPLSDSQSFTDYFVYFLNGTNRPSIWVTLAVGTWGWGGTGTKQTSGTWVASNTTNAKPSAAASS